MMVESEHYASFMTRQVMKHVNQFQMEKIPFVIHPRSNESNMVDKKCFVYFFIGKIYSHVTQNGGQKREW